MGISKNKFWAMAVLEVVQIWSTKFDNNDTGKAWFVTAIILENYDLSPKLYWKSVTCHRNHTGKVWLVIKIILEKCEVLPKSYWKSVICHQNFAGKVWLVTKSILEKYDQLTSKHYFFLLNCTSLSKISLTMIWHFLGVFATLSSFRG